MSYKEAMKYVYRLYIHSCITRQFRKKTLRTQHRSIPCFETQITRQKLEHKELVCEWTKIKSGGRFGFPFCKKIFMGRLYIVDICCCPRSTGEYHLFEKKSYFCCRYAIIWLMHEPQTWCCMTFFLNLLMLAYTSLYRLLRCNQIGC